MWKNIGWICIVAGPIRLANHLADGYKPAPVIQPPTRMASSINQIRLVAQARNGLTREQFSKAVADLRGGWDKKALWYTLGIHDVKQQYRRSIIGPFWITISLGVTVAALGLLYGQIFKQDLDEFIPYLAAGYIVWSLLSQMILDGTSTFVRAERFIRQLSAPLSVHAFQIVWTNLLVFLHNIWVFFVAAIIFPVSLGWWTFLAIPGLIVLLINGFWIALLLGLISARFRDIPLIVRNIVHVTFFITPIIWSADMLPERTVILDYNPVYHFIEIVRAPLLGEIPTFLNYAAAVGVTAAGCLMAIVFYTIYRWRIAYWM